MLGDDIDVSGSPDGKEIRVTALNGGFPDGMSVHILRCRLDLPRIHIGWLNSDELELTVAIYDPDSFDKIKSAIVAIARRAENDDVQWQRPRRIVAEIR